MRSWLLVLVAIAFAPSTAPACSCLHVEFDPARYDALFVGTAIAVVHPDDDPRNRAIDAFGQIEFLFAVEAAWDDVTDPVRIVRTSPDEAACGAPITLGERYLVTAFHSPKDGYAPLMTGLCTYTGDVARRQEQIATLGEPTYRNELSDPNALGTTWLLAGLDSRDPATRKRTHRALRAIEPPFVEAVAPLFDRAVESDGFRESVRDVDALLSILYIDPANPRLIEVATRFLRADRPDVDSVAAFLSGLAEWQWARSVMDPSTQEIHLTRLEEVAPQWRAVLPEPEDLLGTRWPRLQKCAYLLFARSIFEPTVSLAGEPIDPERAVELLEFGLGHSSHELRAEAWRHVYPELVASSPYWEPGDLRRFFELALRSRESRPLALALAASVPEIRATVRIEIPGAPVLETEWPDPIR